MFTLIRTLGPVAAMLVGLAGGSALMGAAAWALNEWVDNPHVRQVEELRCAIRTRDAATAAEKDMRVFLREADDRALEAYQQQVAADAAQREGELKDLEIENAAYEAILAGEGALCALTQRDFDSLRGDKPAPAGS